MSAGICRSKAPFCVAQNSNAIYTNRYAKSLLLLQNYDQYITYNTAEVKYEADI